MAGKKKEKDCRVDPCTGKCSEDGSYTNDGEGNFLTPSGMEDAVLMLKSSGRLKLLQIESAGLANDYHNGS